MIRPITALWRKLGYNRIDAAVFVVVLAFLALLLLTDCGEVRPVVPGPIAAPPSTGNVTNAASALIAGKANAEASGDKATVKALSKALDDEHKQEINGGMRWLITFGVMLLALGAGIAYELGPKLGGGVAIVGASLIGGAMFVTAIQPYIGWIVLGASGVGLVAAAYHFRKYASALGHIAHGTEHLAGPRVRALIGKIRARGPGVVTRIKALLHHAPMAPKAPGA